MDVMDIPMRLAPYMQRIEIAAWRLLIATPHVSATVSMLRGVWGRALRHLDKNAYDRVFVGTGPSHHRRPCYIMRPAPPDPQTAPAVEWIMLSVEPRLEAVLWRAWDIASGMGLGPQRVPFHIRSRVPLGNEDDGTLRAAPRWCLSTVTWPLAGDPASTPCRVSFPAPLRLVQRGELIAAPNLADIVAAAFRRLADLAGMAAGTGYRDLMRAIREEAAGTGASRWQGTRTDFVRWSGAQRREVDLHGVTGTLHLPAGPGQLWPLLAAAQWTHVGKGSVFGLGELRIAAP